MPLASPNLCPQERSCKAPGFAHQPQQQQKPQRELFRGEAVRPGGLCQTLPALSAPSASLHPPASALQPSITAHLAATEIHPLRLHRSHGGFENLNARLPKPPQHLENI